jgi:hypothetical protein
VISPASLRGWRISACFIPWWATAKASTVVTHRVSPLISRGDDAQSAEIGRRGRRMKMDIYRFPPPPRNG